MTQLLSELLDKYVEQSPLLSSEAAIFQYRSVVNRFDCFLENSATVRDLTEANVFAYCENRQKLGRAERTIENELEVLRMLWSYAATLGLCEAPQWKAVSTRTKKKKPAADSLPDITVDDGPAREPPAPPLMTSFTASHTVRAFVLALDQQCPLTRQIINNRTSNVNKLEGFLGRPARLKDLDDRTLAMFFDVLRTTTRLSSASIASVEDVILRIARRAAEMEIIPWPMVSAKDRTITLGVAGNSLLAYFEDRYMVDREQRGKPLAPESVKAYRSAIRSFSRFAPRIHNLHQISRVKLNRFRKWLVDRGMNAKKAGNHAFAVAAIVKHAKPERFLDLDDAPPADCNASRRLAYVFEKYYLPAKQSIASEKSVKKYASVFNSFGRHVGHVVTLDDLTDEKIGSYMRELRRTGRAARTANGYRSKLLALWSWCARKRLVENFPTIEKMPEPRALPTAWTVEDLHKLLAGCERMPGTVGDIPAPDWWRTLHYVAWDTGERTGALLALTWQMLDLKTGQLAVPAEFRKGGKKPMLYRLKPATLQMLSVIREPERELVFPFPQKCMFYYRYRLLLKLAGLPYLRYKSALQKMRRSFATHLEAAGGNATDALSHALRSDTVNSYLDPRLIYKTPPNELLFALGVATA